MAYYRTFNKGQYLEQKVFFKDKEHKIFHREDGPAIIYKNGRKEWWIDNKLHRMDGPAIEYEGRMKIFFINGDVYWEDEYWQKVNEIKRFGDFV